MRCDSCGGELALLMEFDLVRIREVLSYRAPVPMHIVGGWRCVRCGAHLLEYCSDGSCIVN